MPDDPRKEATDAQPAASRAKRRSRIEIRAGFLEPDWLSKTNRCPRGLFDYMLLHKPYGRDFLIARARDFTGVFPVHLRTIRDWLDTLRADGLIWSHSDGRSLCIHFMKPGDYTRGDWIANVTTHADRRKRSADESATSEMAEVPLQRWQKCHNSGGRSARYNARKARQSRAP